MKGAQAREHWRSVYAARSAEEMSWFQASPEPSLTMIRKARLPAGARVIDVGGGASSLVDALLDEGLRVSVLDAAENALDIARSRLGERAGDVTWIVADVTSWRPTEPFDLWHDRAVFHFLTEPAQRARYLETLEAGVPAGGWLILATFAPDGPTKCSGLPVRRWSAAQLAEELGRAFRLVESRKEAHQTPSGSRQPFTWTRFRRTR